MVAGVPRPDGGAPWRGSPTARACREASKAATTAVTRILAEQGANRQQDPLS